MRKFHIAGAPYARWSDYSPGAKERIELTRLSRQVDRLDAEVRELAAIERRLAELELRGGVRRKR